MNLIREEPYSNGRRHELMERGTQTMKSKEKLPAVMEK